jgi:hypothetical protein
MKIKNGKWSSSNDELSIFDKKDLSKNIKKIHVFAEDKELSYDKIRILSNILETSELEDKLMVSILDADKEELKLFLKVTL